MPGVIDEFLIKIGLEGDSSGLEKIYKTIFNLQDELGQRDNNNLSGLDQREQKLSQIAAAQKLLNSTNAGKPGGADSLVDSYKTLLSLLNTYKSTDVEKDKFAAALDDSENLKDSYQELIDLLSEYENKEIEVRQKQESDDKRKQLKQEKDEKRKEKLNKIATTSVSIAKQGIGMARNWAVALLAVDGAAMGVIGRLSQMAVEYDNTAGSINMAASEMKAWEDTMKAAGASVPDVQSSLQSLYEKSYKTMMGEGDSGFQSAMAAFGVNTTENGEMRNTGDIFADVMQGFRDAIEGGMDRNLAIGYLEQAGVSRNLAQPMLRKDEAGNYRATEADFQRFLEKAQPLDDLAEASMDLTATITELAATFRNKFALVLNELMESGVIDRVLQKFTEFVENIDVEAVAEAVGKFIGMLERLVSWLGEKIPEAVDTADRVVSNQRTIRDDPSIAIDIANRTRVLSEAVENAMSRQDWRSFKGLQGAGGFQSEGGVALTETELLTKANELGLNVNQIFQQGGLPEVSNDIKVFIDGKYTPFTRQEYLSYKASSVDSGLVQ